MLGFGLLFPLRLLFGLGFFPLLTHFPHTNRHKPFHHSQPHFPLPAFCSMLLSGEANKQLPPLSVPMPLLRWPTGLPVDSAMTVADKRMGEARGEAGSHCGRDTFSIVLPMLENMKSLCSTVSLQFTLYHRSVVSFKLMVPAVSLSRGLKGKAVAISLLPTLLIVFCHGQ